MWPGRQRLISSLTYLPPSGLAPERFLPIRARVRAGARCWRWGRRRDPLGGSDALTGETGDESTALLSWPQSSNTQHKCFNLIKNQMQTQCKEPQGLVLFFFKHLYIYSIFTVLHSVVTDDKCIICLNCLKDYKQKMFIKKTDQVNLIKQCQDLQQQPQQVSREHVVQMWIIFDFANEI